MLKSIGRRHHPQLINGSGKKSGGWIQRERERKKLNCWQLLNLGIWVLTLVYIQLVCMFDIFQNKKLQKKKYLHEGHRAVPTRSLCKQDLCPKCWEWGQQTPSIAHPSRGCLGCTAALPKVISRQGWPCSVADLCREENVCGLGIPAKRDNCHGLLPVNLPHDASPRRACMAVQLFPLSSAAVSYPLIYAQM